MLDILKLRMGACEFDQLRVCQLSLRSDCHAAFTVSGMELIWPMANWSPTPVEEKINVRGWIPLLDQIADEFLIFRPEGGCLMVHREFVTYRLEEHDSPEVIFLQLEMNSLKVMPRRRDSAKRLYSQT